MRMIQWLLSLFHPRDVCRMMGSKPRSPKWRIVRDWFVKNNPQCCVCETKSNLEVHHIEPYHLFPEKELDKMNLMTLCERCHLFVGHLGSWQAWNPGVVSDAIVWNEKMRERTEMK